MPSGMTVGQVVAQDPVSMGRVTMELPVQVSIRAVIITRIIRAVKGLQPPAAAAAVGLSEPAKTVEQWAVSRFHN